MEIKVTTVGEAQTQAKGKNLWQEVDVSYIGKQGKKDKKIRSFSEPDAFKFFSSGSVKSGDTVEVDVKKEGDYWVWKGGKIAEAREATEDTAISKVSGDTNKGKARGDWETSEERAATQRYIVRQSSIGYSLKYWGLVLQHPRINPNGVTMTSAPGLRQVIDTASVFERFVFGEEEALAGKVYPQAEVNKPVTPVAEEVVATPVKRGRPKAAAIELDDDSPF